ncbi:hypothetical protein L3Q82_004855 [Scortum barcoo]|uniref:Uncharacterized protein n=1 Tax=Scortum barcoo TaxID=214431 RepID=A0ACB8VF02_9TELE|nr:hypothetical protein L3Q82_004855 [Scortum barcoo]
MLVLTASVFFNNHDECLLDSSSSPSSSSSSSPADEAHSPASFLHSSPLSPSFPLDTTPSLSPSQPTFLLPSPASSSSSYSSSSYSLLCGAPDPDSPTGSSSSRGSVGGGAVLSEASVHFSASQTGSFSAQVDSILRGNFLTPLGAVGPKRLCLVCGDFASGYHYGRGVLRGLQGFLQEDHTSKNIYGSKERPKRLKVRTPDVGGVRMDRMRGGRQKYKRRAEPGLSLYSKPPYSHAVGSRNKVISHLLLTEPAPLAANQDDSTNDSSLRTLLTLCDLLNRELLVLIAWAKQIPGFSGLSLVDQMSLLQSGWMEALLVGVAWRSQAAAGEELVFAGNLRLDEGQCRAAGLADLYEALRHLTHAKYQAMNLSPEEVVTLKAMALANSDADPVDCPDAVQRFQDGLHEALQEYESSRREQHRAGRLLMSLPLLRQTADRAVQTFLRLHRHRCVPLHKLLLEMLDAKA